jgi:hypothetical protein
MRTRRGPRRPRLDTGAGVPRLQAVRETYLATEGKVPIITGKYLTPLSETSRQEASVR